jgi:hypothetical protein
MRDGRLPLQALAAAQRRATALEAEVAQMRGRFARRAEADEGLASARVGAEFSRFLLLKMVT